MTYPDFPPAPTPVAMFPTSTRAPVWTCVPTDNPVAFITIDDGFKPEGGDDDEAAAAFVEQHQIPLTCFLTYYAASSGAQPPSTDPAKVAHVEFLRRFRTNGHKVECHSKTHAQLDEMSAATQLSDIGKARDWLARPDMFGAVPTLFRPPYGAYNDDTLAALPQKGFKVCLLWSHAIEDLVADPTIPVRKGEIILMHFTTDLMDHLQVALDRIFAAGLTPAYLADYVL